LLPVQNIGDERRAKGHMDEHFWKENIGGRDFETLKVVENGREDNQGDK